MAARSPVRVTARDRRMWLMHVAGFRDPEGFRALEYAREWNIEAKIRRALLEAAKAGKPRDSIFQRWEHASW